MESWFFIRNGEQAGPVTFDDLRIMAANGELDPADQVWTEGMAAWIEARQAPGLFSAPHVASPPPPLMHAVDPGNTRAHLPPRRAKVPRPLLLGGLAVVVASLISTAVWEIDSVIQSATPVRSRKSARSEDTDQADPPAIKPKAVRENFGMFEFDVPPGWSRVEPDRKKTVAMLLFKGTTWSNAAALIKVDTGTPTAPDSQTAWALAGDDGKVLSTPEMVDGIEGLRVETPSTSISRPRYAIVVSRNGKVFLVMASANSGTDVSAALDQILSSWKWRN